MTDKPYPFTPEQEAWLHDLETTEEPQTKGFLHVLVPGKVGFTSGYCCLGRACIVLGADEHESDDGLGYFWGESVALPGSLTNRLRLRGVCGEFAQVVVDHRERECANLAELNDNDWSFKEIAAYIRANPWNVFLPPEEETA